MSLSTMEPTPTWDPDAHEETVETLAAVADEITVKVWGGDWCGDCRAALPDFAAALEAAGVPEDAIEHYPVEKADDGSKVGPKVEEYGIELIPTIVIEREGVHASEASVGSSGERSESEGVHASEASVGSSGERSESDGEELVRFVESEAVPAAVWLAERLRASEQIA